MYRAIASQARLDHLQKHMGSLKLGYVMSLSDKSNVCRSEKKGHLRPLAGTGPSACLRAENWLNGDLFVELA